MLLDEVCSMALTASLLVDISCLTVMVVAPIGIAQKRKLLKLGTMREQQNHLRGVSSNQGVPVAGL